MKQKCNEEFLYEGFHRISKIESEVKGKKVFREKLYLKDAVAGVVTDEFGNIGLVKQYRPAAGFYSYEIPAGLMDKKGLNSIQMLLEELLEECDIERNEILFINQTPIHEYFMVIGSSDAKIKLYDIQVKKQFNKNVSDNDVDSVIWCSLEEMEELIKNGSIKDPKTIISYYYLYSKVKK